MLISEILQIRLWIVLCLSFANDSSFHKDLQIVRDTILVVYNGIMIYLSGKSNF